MRAIISNPRCNRACGSHNCFSEDTWCGRSRTEVGGELRMAPVNYSRQNDLSKIPPNFGESFFLFGRASWKQFPDRARLDGGTYGKVGDLLPIIGNPVGNLVQLCVKKSSESSCRPTSKKEPLGSAD